MRESWIKPDPRPDTAIPGDQACDAEGHPSLELEERYRRQHHVFTPALRQATQCLVLNSDAAPSVTRWLVAGASAMGISRLGSDALDDAVHPHWLLGPLDSLSAHVNPSGEFVWIDPDFPGDLLTDNDLPNTWIIVMANDGRQARQRLEHLAGRPSRLCPTVLALCGPAGLWISRYMDPASALSALHDCPMAQSMAPAPPELAILAAGLILGEIMLGPGDPLQSPAPSRLVACYDLWHPRRTPQQANTTVSPILWNEIATSPDTQGIFHGKRLIMVGGGALGNWAVIPLALERPDHMQIYDGDVIELHNLNRQLLFMDGVGSNKAEYLSKFLNDLTQSPVYEAIPRYVETTEDFDDLQCDGVVCVPDNDRTRLICGAAAMAHRRILATAGSSAQGGQSIIADPRHACLSCIMGNVGSDSSTQPNGQSCGRVTNDAVVSSNMVAAGLLVSELRMALSGRSWSNMRYDGRGACANRLRRMITRVPCHHVNSSEKR